MQRVVITGLGCITPIGNTAEAVWQSLESGRSGIRPFVPATGEPDDRIKFKNAGQVLDFDPSGLSSMQLNTAERNSQFAIFAGRQAVAQSGLTQHHPPDNIEIVIGCCRV